MVEKREVLWSKACESIFRGIFKHTGIKIGKFDQTELD